jgi:hypothetical protein
MDGDEEEASDSLDDARTDDDEETSDTAQSPAATPMILKRSGNKASKPYSPIDGFGPPTTKRTVQQKLMG